MDLGISNGVFNNPEVGLIKGAETGLIEGSFNGVFNENLFTNSIVRDKLITHLDISNNFSYPKSGATWKDLSGNGYNATLQSNVSYSTLNGGSFKTSGTATGSISLPANAIWDFGTSDFSLCMWLKTGDCCEPIRYDTAFSGGLWWVESQGYSGSNYSIIFKYWDSGRSINRILNSGPIAIPKDSWIYFVGTRKYGSTSESGPKIYINGILKASLLGSDTLNVVAQSGAYPSIGKAGSYPQYSVVTVAMLSIYKKELSADEVMQNYNATKFRFNL